MCSGISFDVTAEDRARLEAIIADRNGPQKHVCRARIILLSHAGFGTAEIMRQTPKAKTCVWRWQERFMQEGVEGLLPRRFGGDTPSGGTRGNERTGSRTTADWSMSVPASEARLPRRRWSVPPPARSYGAYACRLRPASRTTMFK